MSPSLIPRLLHQTFQSWSALPEPLRDNALHTQSQNPDYECSFYDDDDLPAAIESWYGAEMRETYLRIRPEWGPARADLFRYLCVYHLGGVYLDIKAHVRRPLREVIRKDDAYVISQWDHDKYPEWGLLEWLPDVPGGEYHQWHVIGAPGHPFLEAVIERVVRGIQEYSPLKYGCGRHAVLRVTGPYAYTRAIHPLLSFYPHRRVDIERDLGIEYSIFPKRHDHRAVMAGHYSKRTGPLVRGGLGLQIGCLAARILYRVRRSGW